MLYETEAALFVFYTDDGTFPNPWHRCELTLDSSYCIESLVYCL